MRHTFPEKPADKSWKDFVAETERFYADEDTTQTETEKLDTKLSLQLKLQAETLTRLDQLLSR